MALTAARQLRPSLISVHTPAYPPPPPPTCSQHGPRQASTVPTTPPALSLAQSQQVKTTLTISSTRYPVGCLLQLYDL